MRTPRGIRLPALFAFLTVLLVNCGDNTRLTDPGTPDAFRVTGIQPANALEAAHHPSFPRLYFLPPLVPNAPFEGSFDPSLLDHLAVEICRAENSACVAAPAAEFTAGSGSGAIRLDEAHYIVNWQVKGPGITSGNYRLNVRLGAVIIGGLDLRLASRPQDLRDLPPEFAAVNIGRTVPIKFRVEQATDAVTSIVLEPATAIVGIGGTQQYTATVIGADGTPRPGEPVTWTSSDVGIATVSGSGLATGVTVGTATITAAAAGVSATASLDVRAPDLRIRTFTALSSVVLGNALELSATVVNSGNADAAATNIRFRVLTSEGAEFAASATAQDALAAGAEATVSTSFTPDVDWPRSFTVEVTTDRGATVTESDEGNNSATSGDISLVAPDLIVSATPSSATVPAGSDFTISAVVRNDGTSEAAAATLRYRILNTAGEELAVVTKDQAALAADAEQTIDATFTAAFDWPAQITAEVTADADARVTEWDEANNTATTSQFIVTRPDLSVSNVTVPATVPAGTNIDVTATILNSGNGPAAVTDVRFRFLKAGTTDVVATMIASQAAIAGGAALDVSISVTTLPDWPRELVVEVTTDAGATVTESDETNNTTTSATVTLTLADLTVTAVAVPANLPAGGVFNVEATVANGGTAPSLATQARFRVLDPATDTELATVTQPQAAIAAGANATIAASFTTSRDWPRTVVVEATTDPGALVPELDETNNSRRSATIGLTDPDLVVTSVDFSMATVGLRCSLGISAVVKNAGTGYAPAANLRFSLRNEAGDVVAFIVVAQPALAAGAEATVNGAFTAGSDWPGQVAGIAEADVAATVPESNETNNSGSAAVMVQTRVLVPTGYHKMWVCGSTASWTDANNWEPAGVPTAGQNVYVPAGIAQYPVLAAAQSVTDLLVEEGANINIAAHDLNATGNVISGSITGTTGTLDMHGAGKTLRGSVPALEIQGSIALSGTASAGSVVVAGGRTLTLAGNSMSVTGAFTVNANGTTFKHLLMTNPADVLDVGGAMTVQGENLLTAGTIVLRGSFAQGYRGTALQIGAGGTRVAFAGTGPQVVSFQDATNSWFGDVDVRNADPGVVTFSTNVRVAGQLSVAAGGRITQSGGSTYYTSRLPLEAASAGYQVANSVADGAVILSQSVSLAWAGAGVRVSGGRTLDLKGFTLAIGGDFDVSANGTTFKHLYMVTGGDRLDVGGNMTTQGENSLTAGTIVLRGNFAQGYRGTAMQPNGTTIVFAGAPGQAVSFQDATNSWFDDVEVQTAAPEGVTFQTDVRVTGQLSVAAGGRLNQTAATTFYTTRLPVEQEDQAYRVQSSAVDGAVIGSRNVSLAWLDANVRINGGRTLDPKGFTFVIGGDFSVSPNGTTFDHLLMSTASDRIEVGGKMILEGENALTKGTIVLRGGFAQGYRGTALQVVAGGTRFEFEGTAAQAVTFQDATNSYFGDVIIRNSDPGVVAFGTNVRVTGQLSMEAGARLTQAATLHTAYTTRLPDPGPAAYEVNNSQADGTVVLVKNLSLPWASADVEVTGGHTLNLSGFTLAIGGDFRVAPNGTTFKHLYMLTAADRLEVGGDMSLQGENSLMGGAIHLRGGFAQGYRGTALQANGTKFVFDGTAAVQTVTFQDATNSWFDDVEVRTVAPNRVDFASNVRITGQLTMAATSRLTQSSGSAFYTTRLPDPGAGSYEVPTTYADGAVLLDRNITMPASTANVRVSGGHTLDLKGYTLAVGGNFNVNPNGTTFKHLYMVTGTDVLVVGGTMQVEGENSLTRGTIVLRGNFAQGYRGTALQIAGGGTRMVFDGASPQSVSFQDATNSYFGDVEVRTPAAASVTLATNVRVTGQLTVADGARITQSSGGTYYTTRVPDPGTGSYEVPMSYADGAVALDRDIAWASAVANLTVSGGHTLDIGAYTLSLAGSFFVAPNGTTFKHLRMASADSRLVVGGTMTVQGENTLSAGTVVLLGGFAQGYRGTALQPGGTKFVFDGPAAQTVSFQDATNSWFRDVQVMPGANVSFTTNGRMTGSLDLDGALSVLAARTLTVAGTLFFSGALTNNGVVNVGSCVNEGGTFSGIGNNPCP